MSQLLTLDQQLLLLINGAHTAWLDMVMWYISKTFVWIPLYAVLLYAVIKQMGWKQTLVVVVMTALVITLADQVSSGIIKPLVARPRPTHDEGLADKLHLVNGYRGGMYGFVSSHAANCMACALLFMLLLKRHWVNITMSTYVVLNCYSRMYLAVHYPLDILGGLVVGTAAALLGYWLTTLIARSSSLSKRNV
mgnify:CR=1 FL=1